MQIDIFTDLDHLVIPAYYETKPLKIATWRLAVVNFSGRTVSIYNPVDDSDQSATAYKRREGTFRKVSAPTSLLKNRNSYSLCL